MGDVIIAAHVVAGFAALFVGYRALTARKRRGRHTNLGEIYTWTMLPLLATGVAIGASDPEISPFEIAVFPTAIPLLIGYLAGKRRARWLGRPWVAWHIGGMGGSFIGVVTAGLFQVVLRVLPPDPAIITATFALPSAVGSVLIARATARRMPRRASKAAAAVG
jgi:hypothetical protein